MPDFYYPIYPSMRVGGGPEPYLYSAADQAASNAMADARVKGEVAAVESSYMRRGLWEPAHPPRALTETDAVGGIVDGVV
ncbi:hypothetical protein DPQ33_09085 [Oceanidesulfovibrio indonesiensis]|uniref:Uncharacterized protein n=1 Tax=Oceanidesulfovibrio indonesiensis TaxID=54767 RepID=A0A7M3MEL0_9BACT|nr:hypothetical protein [Oceanidesulfovibrio indonesiensis]TVM17330.1 hypothetical protein DPQ33_09085 [Oceanidesulfovibrio indonesiensis]